MLTVVHGSLPSQETSIRAGLSFTPSYRLVLTGRNYVVPFALRATDVQAPLVRALNLTAELAWNIEHMSRDYPLIDSIKATLSNFDREFHYIFVDLNDYLKYVFEADLGRFHYALPPRGKRGLINFVGSLSNVLFGTATQQQVDAIDSKITELSTLTEQQRVMLNVHSETLNATLRNMHAMQSALHRLSSAVNISHQIVRQFSIRRWKWKVNSVFYKL